MRQILAWQWAGGLALALIPLLPIVVTAMFYWFGIRSLGAGAYGGYVYCVVAVVLAGFSVFAANEYCLGGAVAQRMAFCLAAASSAALAGATLRRTGETVFLHLAAGGGALALAAAIPAQGAGTWVEPGHVVMFGGSQTLLALAYAGAARWLMLTSPDSARSLHQAGALLLWAHVCAAAAAGRAGLGMVAGEDAAQTAAVFAAAGALYAAVAHWHRIAAAAWLSAALMAAAVLLALQALGGLSWHSAGLAAVVLHLAAGGLARHAAAAGITAESQAVAASGVLTVSWGLLAASQCQSSADWALRVAGAAAAWLAAALLLRRIGRTELAKALGRLAVVSAALAAAAAAPSIGDSRRAMLSISVFGVAGGVEAGVLPVLNNRVHAHGAFAALAVAYMSALRHGLGSGAAFSDFYLLPVAVYLLILGHLEARRHHPARAATLRWLGLGAALVPAMAAFAGGSARGGTVHGLLLVVECVAAIGCGLAGRVRAFVQAGTAGALLYVVVSALAVTEIWAGVFSAALGIALLALIFYLSVHAGEVRSRMERLSGGRRH